MKGINEKFTDEEHQALVKAKDKDSWHDFILKLLKLKDVAILIKQAPTFDGGDIAGFMDEYGVWLEEFKEVLS